MGKATINGTFLSFWWLWWYLVMPWNYSLNIRHIPIAWSQICVNSLLNHGFWGVLNLEIRDWSLAGNIYIYIYICIYIYTWNPHDASILFWMVNLQNFMGQHLENKGHVGFRYMYYEQFLEFWEENKQRFTHPSPTGPASRCENIQGLGLSRANRPNWIQTKHGA